MSSRNDPARVAARARNRAWVKRHPLVAIVILVALVAGDLWVRIDTGGQHTSGEDFVITLAVVVPVLLIFAAVLIHRGNRRAQGD
jgi:hypothetical protein